MDDLINRQAVITTLCERRCGNKPKECPSGFCTESLAVDCIPSAGPEPLTDKEQRIFLAAMGREEEVCKQVDEECRNCREPYEDSLIRTCREIIRKVKGALWT